MDTFLSFSLKFFSIVFRVKYPLRPIHGIVLYAGIYGTKVKERSIYIYKKQAEHFILFRYSAIQDNRYSVCK